MSVPENAVGPTALLRSATGGVYGDAESVFYVLIFSLMAVVLVVGTVSTMTRRRRNLEREEAEMGDDADWPEQR